MRLLLGLNFTPLLCFATPMLNEQDLKTRTQWFVLLIITTVIALPDPHGIIRLTTANTDPLWVRVFAQSFNTTTALLWSLILYCCAYKKPGTKILTLYLIFIPMKYIACFCVFFKIDLLYKIVNFSNKIPNELQNETLMFILWQAIAIWRYVLDWKMRTLNKKLQRLPIVSSQTR